MKYEGITTFSTEQQDGILTVTVNFGSVNVQGQEMLADLNSLAMRLERDRETKVVVFQSANPEVWVCHYDTELLKDMSDEAVSREEAQLLDLQAVCERISKVPQATIAKLEGFARGGGHELALALDLNAATAAGQAPVTVSWPIVLGSNSANDSAGSIVEASHSGDLMTLGNDAVASASQSIGGGGCNGQVALTINGAMSVDLALALGGRGGLVLSAEAAGLGPLAWMGLLRR